MARTLFTEKYPIINLKAESILFRPGQDCQGFVLILDGTIKVYLGAENGREIILYRVNRGEICLQTFRCLIKNQTYSAEAIAETDIAIQIIPQNDFYDLIERDKGFRDNVFAAIALRFNDFENLIENVTLSSIEVRIARALLRLMDNNNQINITQENLAIETGTVREVINRHLNKMVKSGILKITRGKIIILKPPELQKLQNM